MFRNVVWRVSRLSWILPIFLYWLVARLVLLISLDLLDVNYSQWHEMQLEKIILQTIAPDAVIPDTAVLDFIVAISVLPMATFTTVSVLGGSQEMPRWMLGQEETLESLGAKKLEQTNQKEDDDKEEQGQHLEGYESEEDDSDLEDGGHAIRHLRRRLSQWPIH